VNTKFAVALHVLTLLADNRGSAVTSEFIAGSVQTNAVVIRRILSLLREQRLVEAIQGPGGGFVLARDPAKLTLREVYEAVAERDVIGVHSDANPRCPVGRNIGTVLEDVVTKAQEAMLRSLAESTIASLARRVAKCEKAS
jgi:Rrf2 family protein